jgi:dTMP kinase
MTIYHGRPTVTDAITGRREPLGRTGADDYHNPAVGRTVERGLTMIIAFEGMDGSGKSTQAGRLRDRLRAAGYDAVVLPLFRSDNVEYMLDALDDTGGVSNDAARIAVLAKVVARDEYLVRGLVERGCVVIYDKFLLTHMATELIRGGRPYEFAAAAAPVLAPDLTFLFTVDPKESLRRKDRVGFREAGLDIEMEAGRASYAAYRAGEYSAEWMAERFVDFQSKIAARLSLAADDDIARTLPYARDVVRMEPIPSADEIQKAILDRVCAVLPSSGDHSGL